METSSTQLQNESLHNVEDFPTFWSWVSKLSYAPRPRLGSGSYQPSHWDKRPAGKSAWQVRRPKTAYVDYVGSIAQEFFGDCRPGFVRIWEQCLGHLALKKMLMLKSVTALLCAPGTWIIETIAKGWHWPFQKIPIIRELPHNCGIIGYL